MICPLCHGAKDEADTLDRLPAEKVHCSTCMVDFEADLERSVELTFLPTAGVFEAATQGSGQREASSNPALHLDHVKRSASRSGSQP